MHCITFELSASSSCFSMAAYLLASSSCSFSPRYTLASASFNADRSLRTSLSAVSTSILEVSSSSVSCWWEAQGNASGLMRPQNKKGKRNGKGPPAVATHLQWLEIRCVGFQQTMSLPLIAAATCLPAAEAVPPVPHFLRARLGPPPSILQPHFSISTVGR